MKSFIILPRRIAFSVRDWLVYDLQWWQHISRKDDLLTLACALLAFYNLAYRLWPYEFQAFEVNCLRHWGNAAAWLIGNRPYLIFALLVLFYTFLLHRTNGGTEGGTKGGTKGRGSSNAER